MNENPHNPANIDSNTPSGVKANPSYSTVFSSHRSDFDGNGSSHCFDEFFDKCKKISESERTIKEALENVSQFKALLSQALNRPIETQYSFRSAINEIRPAIEFWIKYGDKFKSFINGENDVQKLLDSYQQCPELIQEINQLRVAVTDRDTQISALQESVLAKQLDETKNQLDEERGRNTQLCEDINSLKGSILDLEEDLSNSRAENKRISDEAENLKEKLASEQSSYQDEIGRVTNAYRNKSERVEQLQNEIVTYQIIRNLIADAFKIDTRTESEFIHALGKARTILRACVEMGKNSPLGDNVIERMEDILKDNARMREVEADNKRKEETIDKLKSDIRKKDADICDQEQKINDSTTTIDTMTRDIATYKQQITDLTDSKTDLLNRFNETSASLDIYLDFIYSVMAIREMQWSPTIAPQAQKQVLESFSNEYKRVLTLCQSFEDIKHSKNTDIDLDRLETHQAEMISALDKFYQYAKKTTNDSSVGNGTTLYEKIAPLPNVQEQLSRSIESAVFSINYSREKIEECEELQKTLHELQLQYEKKNNVLMMLERKIYPYFMTAQNLGRRDKLIDDIEFGLANDIVPALPLKSYLGLLSFVEKDYDSISDETLLWILQQLPKALYNFYQETILEGATDISSDEVIYDVMNQLMNKINKFILKGSFFLSMPRLGSPISLDSMEMFEKTNSVNAVLSWMISDSRHKIIQKALVK